MYIEAMLYINEQASSLGKEIHELQIILVSQICWINNHKKQM